MYMSIVLLLLISDRAKFYVSKKKETHTNKQVKTKSVIEKSNAVLYNM
jgi:hypothetical protein